jgi:nicotinate-nucleotide--dimethylbenzimidazole phosphoribosyltransferase
MTDTGQIPGEGQPDSAGAQPEGQPEVPATATAPYTYAGAGEAGGIPGDDEDLLMPGAQGAWSEAQMTAPAAAHGQQQARYEQQVPYEQGVAYEQQLAYDQQAAQQAAYAQQWNGQQQPQAEQAQAGPRPGDPEPGAPEHGPVPAPAPAAEGGHVPGPHEMDGRDSGSIDCSAVRASAAASDSERPSPNPAPRRPLHLGPPEPEPSGTVRPLSDRGRPNPAPSSPVSPSPAAPAPGASSPSEGSGLPSVPSIPTVPSIPSAPCQGQAQQVPESEPLPQHGAEAGGAQYPAQYAEAPLPEPETLPGPQLGALPPDAQPQQQHQPEPEHQPEPQPQSQPQSQPEPQAQQAAEPMPESEPEPLTPGTGEQAAPEGAQQATIAAQDAGPRHASVPEANAGAHARVSQEPGGEIPPQQQAESSAAAAEPVQSAEPVQLVETAETAVDDPGTVEAGENATAATAASGPAADAEAPEEDARGSGHLWISAPGSAAVEAAPAPDAEAAAPEAPAETDTGSNEVNDQPQASGSTEAAAPQPDSGAPEGEEPAVEAGDAGPAGAQEPENATSPQPDAAPPEPEDAAPLEPEDATSPGEQQAQPAPSALVAADEAMTPAPAPGWAGAPEQGGAALQPEAQQTGTEGEETSAQVPEAAGPDGGETAGSGETGESAEEPVEQIARVEQPEQPEQAEQPEEAEQAGQVAQTEQTEGDAQPAEQPQPEAGTPNEGTEPAEAAPPEEDAAGRPGTEPEPEPVVVAMPETHEPAPPISETVEAAAAETTPAAEDAHSDAPADADVPVPAQTPAETGADAPAEPGQAPAPEAGNEANEAGSGSVNDPESGAGPQPEGEASPAAVLGSDSEPEPVPDSEAAPAAEPAPVPETAPAAGFEEAEREAVHRLMRERRDIRNGFRPDPIPHEVLLRVLEAAHTAPSVGHSQPWDFVVIRSEETRRTMHEMAQRQREAYAESLPKARAKQFKELKIEAILDTPVNIVVTADPTRGGRHTLGRHTQPQMAPYSSALAVENLWLAARAEGLGVGWVSFFDEREMVRTLELPEHLEVVAYLCVGYVDEFPPEPELAQAGWSKRRPLSWVVHEESYGRRVLPGAEPHDLLAETMEAIRPLDAKALGEAWERQKRMTKPPGALGMLEIISAQLCGLSRKCPPPLPEPAAVAVFAGDHGVHAQGVTPWPQEVTAQMVANFLGGGAVCNAFANQVGAEVCVIDVGVAGELPSMPGLLPRKVRAGTADMTTGPALTREEAMRGIEVGIETARDLVAAGNKALLTGEMGIANTTASAALISACTGADPAEVTGRGTGINDETHALKVDVVRRALELHKPDPADPIGMLAAVGGLEQAAIVGLILGGASLRTPVILDGVSAGAAALVARCVAPEALAACIAGHRSAEPGHVAALTKLGLRPLVDLDLRLGEGTGALLALPMVQSAARAMHEVATFDAAGVTEKG